MKYYDLFIEFVNWYESKLGLLHCNPFGFEYVDLDNGHEVTRIPTFYDVIEFYMDNSNLIDWTDEKVDALYYYFVDPLFPERSDNHKERFGNI